MNILTYDLIILIMKNIEIIRDKKNFIMINREYYKILKKQIEKYKIIKYLNNDYSNFYKILTKNHYDLKYKSDIDILSNVIVKSFMNIPIINDSKVYGIYDLRYIFELLYSGYEIKTNDIKIYNVHFYIHFYDKIMKCIVYNSRQKTIENIERCPYLTSLKQNPKFKNQKDWISIKQIQ